MVLRLPPFDFHEHKTKAYLKIKSPTIKLLKVPKYGGSEQIIWIPTDDDRLKVILIPTTFIDSSLPLD